MICKISNGKNSNFGALRYNFRKVDNGTAKIIHSKDILQSPLTGEITEPLAIAAFEALTSRNPRIKNPIFHCSINPDYEDQLSTEQLKKIANEFMRRMGYKDQPYIVFLHEDVGRPHIHIVAPRVDKQGQKINDSFELKKAMMIMADIEERLELRKIDRGWQKKDSMSQNIPDLPSLEQLEKMPTIERIRTVMTYATARYAFQSIGELNAFIEKYGVHAEETKKERNGIQKTGVIYSIIDAKKNKLTTPIEGRRIAHCCKAFVLNQHFAKSKKIISNKKSLLYKALSTAKKDSNSFEEFRENLKKFNIELVTRENEQGLIYGCTFIDNFTNTIYNGSRIGKEFSANKLNEYFSPQNATKRKQERYRGGNRRRQEGHKKAPDADRKGKPSEEHKISLFEEFFQKVEKLPTESLLDFDSPSIHLNINELVTSYDHEWKERVWQRKLRYRSNSQPRRRKKR